MIITNLTNVEYWFGPMHLPAGSGTASINLDDTSDTSLYLLNDEVADAVHTLYLSSNIMVTSQAAPFPRPTGTPSLLHGDGSPQGMVYAPQGSLYMRRDSVHATTSLYSKTTGVTQNTGWISLSTGMEFIDEFTVSSPTAQITFPSIPQAYTHLKVIASLKDAFGSADPSGLYMIVNEQTTENYWYQSVYSQNDDAPATGTSDGATTSIQLGYMPYAVFGSTEITLTGYTSTAFVSFVATNGAIDESNQQLTTTAGLITTGGGTGPITSIQLNAQSGSQFDIGSVATLYGMAGNAT